MVVYLFRQICYILGRHFLIVVLNPSVIRCCFVLFNVVEIFLNPIGDKLSKSIRTYVMWTTFSSWNVDMWILCCRNGQLTLCLNFFSHTAFTICFFVINTWAVYSEGNITFRDHNSSFSKNKLKTVVFILFSLRFKSSTSKSSSCFRFLVFFYKQVTYESRDL